MSLDTSSFCFGGTSTWQQDQSRERIGASWNAGYVLADVRVDVFGRRGSHGVDRARYDAIAELAGALDKIMALLTIVLRVAVP